MSAVQLTGSKQHVPCQAARRSSPGCTVQPIHQAVAPLHLALRRPRAVQMNTAAVELASTVTKPVLTKADILSLEYNRQMKDAMGWENRPYEYSYERGLYYHQILPNLVCGSQPRHGEDVEELKRDLQLDTIVSLQQDKDLQHWGVNPHEIRQRCDALGIDWVRCPVRDFDPDSLRRVLPMAVREVHTALEAGNRVYVHCTAGLGRAPGVIIAYLYWFHAMDLHTAYDTLTSIRPCGPKKEAIRGATFDIVTHKPMDHLHRLPAHAFTDLSAHERVLLKERVLQARAH